MTYYADDTVTLHHGDCLDVLRTLPDASVDAVVTDPPYGLEFMGKEWDSFNGDNRQPFRGEIQTPDNPYGRSTVRFAGSATYGGKHGVAMQQFQQWCELWATECLRVLKPDHGPEEASADMREAARVMRDMYVALIAEGFTVPEALEIIGHAIRGQK